MPSKNARLPLPTVVNPPNRRCVTLSIPDDEEHWAAFWGVLFEMAKAYSWEDDTAHTAVEVAQVYRQVYEDARQRWNEKECGSTPEEGECFENRPSSPAISWYPQNPYTQPDFVPTGYLNPPWHVVNASDTVLLALGFQIGDVQTDLADFPPGSLPTIIPPGGLPRFQISFEGTSDPDGVTVELHFVVIPAGGRAVIIDDGQVIAPPPEVANMNRDLLAVPPVTSLEVVIERKFLGAGLHTCEAQMFPAVNDEVPFLYFGGGLRKIVLCGKDFPGVVAEFRQVDCVLEYRPTSAAAWLPIYDPTNCVGEIIREKIRKGEIAGGQEGPGGAGPTPATCYEYDVTLRADSRWIAPIPIKANYEITITEAAGGTSDGTLLWFCPDGLPYTLGECGGIGFTDPADPMPAQNHMRLIMRYNAAFFDAYNTVHNVSPGLVGAHNLEFQVNDETISDNEGSYSFHLKICNQPTAELLYDQAAGQQVTITQLETHKWHVDIFGTTPGLPFAPYALTLWFGQASPYSDTCARWEFTNQVGWSGETDPEHLDAKCYRQLCNGTVEFSPDQQPISTWADGLCLKQVFGRSATAYSFDVELFFDCP